MHEAHITEKKAIENYTGNSAWPVDDLWHEMTFRSIFSFVTTTLKQKCNRDSIILNAGSGGTEYGDYPNMIHMDIVPTNIIQLPHHIVGSVTQIPLPDQSVDAVICVGSVINYTDAQRCLSEFSRILKQNGILILEFERSNSAEFWFTRNYNRLVFLQKYHYNGQEHLLWMYRERDIIRKLKLYGLRIIKKKRFHSVSTLLNRLGMCEKHAAKWMNADKLLRWCSYCIAHNCILLSQKS